MASVKPGVTEERHVELAVEDASLEVRRVSLLLLDWTRRCILLVFYSVSSPKFVGHGVECTEKSTGMIQSLCLSAVNASIQSRMKVSWPSPRTVAVRGRTGER